jgi:CRISPR-associated exonuclease Cas4
VTANLDVDSDVGTVSNDVSTRDRTDPRINTLIGNIDAASFADWYQEREFTRNIREGKPYFNGPGRIPTPERHSPSQLNQCHRKIYYRQLNAPEEQPDPQGIFWTGTKFEEELVVPYLEAIVGADEYVRNSMWIDITCETDAGEIRIKGATDPVIVDAESEPLLLTESKTKRSLDHLDEPDRHHLAQTHCYMYGLTQKHDRRVTDALLLYGSRMSLDLRAFHVGFDPWFWRRTVLSWAEDHTQLRLDEELPAADPELPWECNVCSYRHRCGQADDTSFGDLGAMGFLPRFEDYPREKVREYLNSHDGARLTPTLARRYPDLVDQYGVHDWECRRCSATYGFGEFDQEEDLARNEGAADAPLCPDCASENVPIPLRGFAPREHALGAADD